MMSQHSLTNTITSLYLREGSVFADDNADVHRTRINWELNSGQWVMLTGENNELLAWASYYLVDDVTAERLHDGADDIVRSGDMVELKDGNVVFVASIVLAPWAEKGIAKKLYRLLVDFNLGADRIAWTHHKIFKNLTLKNVNK